MKINSSEKGSLEDIQGKINVLLNDKIIFYKQCLWFC